MERALALRVLTERLGYTEETAPLVLSRVDALIATTKGKKHSLEDEGYPLNWLPSLLLRAGEIGHTRFEELVRTDFTPHETLAEKQELLAQAFAGIGW